ncbi:MAG TPA: uroporphyrinogen decarboxylase family protein [Bacteroidales bacterium]|nr:uroporphyrinogen decarboxylase family protein [Bacteroidales bacterium]
MNSKKRIKLALNHTEPDRVPYDLAGTTVTGISKKAFIRAMKLRGISQEYEIKEIDPIQQIVTPVESTLNELRSDTRRIGARRIPDFEKIVSRIDEKLSLTDVWGCEWKMNENTDFYFNQCSFPLESYPSIEEGLKNYKIPSINYHKEIILSDLEEQVKSIKGYGVIADRNCAGLTETSLRIRGYQNWFIDTITDKAGVEKLFDIVLEYKFSYWDLVTDWLIKNDLDGEVDVISECDDLGTQTSTLIEPEYLRTAVIPRFGSLWAHIKNKLPHVKIFMHTCGSVRELLPDLIEAGLDIYNPVQFTAANMDIKALKRDFGKDLVFWGGGINTQSTLKSGSVSEVKDEVKRIIDIMAPGGGFVYTPVHNVQEDVPAENFWAMWDTLMEFGRY